MITAMRLELIMTVRTVILETHVWDVMIMTVCMIHASLMVGVHSQEERMRARLNKTQIQMLLDGKSLKSGKKNFALPEGESDVRTLLEEFVNDEDLRSRHSLLIDLDERVIVMEENR